MKVYLDDVRSVGWTTHGTEWADWVVVRTMGNFIKLVKYAKPEMVSLDYDLSESDPEHTGLDAVNYILEMLENDPTLIGPSVYIHSAHSMADEMNKVAQKIYALQHQRKVSSEEQ